MELIPEKEEQPAPIPQEELPGQLPPENESGLPEEAEYEEGLEEPDGGEEYGQEPEDEQKPKLGFGRRLKAFFKITSHTSSRRSRRRPLCGGRLGGSPDTGGSPRARGCLGR